MATGSIAAGEASTGYGPTTNYLPHQQQHLHTTHVHALAYCGQCDAAYCTVCERQWGGCAAYTVTSTSVAGAPAFDGTINHGGH